MAQKHSTEHKEQEETEVLPKPTTTKLPPINQDPKKPQNPSKPPLTDGLSDLGSPSDKQATTPKSSSHTRREEQVQILESAERSLKATKPSESTKKYKEKSRVLNLMRLIAFVLSNYYFGYYLFISNVLAPTLTEDVFGVNEDDREKIAGNFGFLYAVGCIISSISAGFLTRNVGRIRLALVLEACKAVSIFFYRFENLRVFLAVRLVSGVLGGVGLALGPLLCKEKKSFLGGFALMEAQPRSASALGSRLSPRCRIRYLVGRTG